MGKELNIIIFHYVYFFRKQDLIFKLIKTDNMHKMSNCYLGKIRENQFVACRFFQSVLFLKAYVKFQKDRPKTVGGVKGTRYLLPIHFCSIRTQKMSKFAEKVIKNYFRILKKPHAYLQAILKAQFQNDRPKTVGGVKGTSTYSL